MSDQTVTELVIDADTSGADQYAQAMDRAADASEKGVSSAQSAILAIAGVGAASVAALAGLRGFYDWVGKQSQVLVDLEDRAQLAGLSVKEFQETLFAAMSAGVKEKDFNSGLDKITDDLTQASQKATEFGKLFEANGLSIKNQNGQLISTKQALGEIAGLMQNASPQVQQAIARIVGLSRDWIPFLRQGADAIEEQKRKAQDLGIIIGDDTIAKASEFNAKWKEAVAIWDLQFKASIASILPLLMQLADLASRIIAGVGTITNAVGRWVTPDDQKTKSQLNDQINDVYRLREALESLNGDMSGGMPFGKQHQARNLASMLGLSENASIADVDRLLDKLSALYDKPERIRVTPNASTTQLPDMNQKDALERAMDASKRHTDQLYAEADAVGLGAAAMARYRTEAQLTSVAENAGIPITDALKQKIEDLADNAADAAGDLAKVKVASQIDFDRKTAFLSPQDLAIAQQLRDIYGNDVPAALSSSEASAIRLNNAIKDGRDVGLDFAKTFVQGLMQGKSGMEALTLQRISSHPRWPTRR